jgi:hypothetical protein
MTEYIVLNFSGDHRSIWLIRRATQLLIPSAMSLDSRCSEQLVARAAAPRQNIRPPQLPVLTQTCKQFGKQVNRPHPSAATSTSSCSFMKLRYVVFPCHRSQREHPAIVKNTEAYIFHIHANDVPEIAFTARGISPTAVRKRL